MKRIITASILAILPVVALAQPLIINAVGDIMLAGTGESTYKRKGYDYPFDSTRSILKQGDIVTGNLEAPLATSGEEYIGKKFRFKTNPKAAAALKNAGFSHVSLANNHIMDYGAEGLRQTLAVLDTAGIIQTGAGMNLPLARAAKFFTVKGLKIAFLSYSLTYPDEFFAGETTPGTAPGYARLFTADIRQAKKTADCVIVAFHWGEEGLFRPKPYQVSAAHKAVDAGADIIIGHHPHVLQGVERYGSGVIFYSLGNFAFGSMGRSSSSSMIARVIFDKGIRGVEIIPLNVLNSEIGFQPKVLTGSRAEAVAETLNELSKPLGSRVTSVNGRYSVVGSKD